LPRELAGRNRDAITVIPHSREDAEMFEYGKQQFLNEGKTLARFNHANIVRVRTLFEENCTAYLVMDYYDGISLAEYLAQMGGMIPEESAIKIMMPILDGLREVHKKGFLHRDVKPQNIYLTRKGMPILLDFSSARFAMGERSRSLSVVLSPGYAPPEQYNRSGKQGPWTDIYACGATLYRMITGEVPLEAMDRMQEDNIRKPSDMKIVISNNMEYSLLKALTLNVEQRYQSIKLFQEEIDHNADITLEENINETPISINIFKYSSGAIAKSFVWGLLLFVIITFVFKLGSITKNQSDVERTEIQKNENVAASVNSQNETRELRMKLETIINLENKYFQEHGRYVFFNYITYLKEIPEYDPNIDGKFMYCFDEETGVAFGMEKNISSDVNGDYDGNDGLYLNVNWDAGIVEGSAGPNFCWPESDITRFKKQHTTAEYLGTYIKKIKYFESYELRKQLVDIIYLENQYFQEHGEYISFDYFTIPKEIPKYHPKYDGNFKYKFNAETGVASGIEKDVSSDVNGDYDGNDGLSLNVNWMSSVLEGSKGANFVWVEKEIDAFKYRQLASDSVRSALSGK
jgi:serine/threonine protein kinase